jgi:hypothetical protein
LLKSREKPTSLLGINLSTVGDEGGLLIVWLKRKYESVLSVGDANVVFIARDKTLLKILAAALPF